MQNFIKMNVKDKLARMAGMLYLVLIIAGGFTEAFARENLTVPAGAIATAHNILVSGRMFRLALLPVCLCWSTEQDHLLYSISFSSGSRETFPCWLSCFPP